MSCSSENPADKQRCREMLQKILDGDATPEQQREFQQHMQHCLPCYNAYELEMAIRALLKSRCNGNGAPPELVEKIKQQIQTLR
jgi:anti-sigma factor (TIGR02949 family)